MTMKFRLLPWQPQLILTGRSFYGVSTASNKITYQTDVWDAVQDNSFLSVSFVNALLEQQQQSIEPDGAVHSLDSG